MFGVSAYARFLARNLVTRPQSSVKEFFFVDVNECQDGLHNCSEQAECVNTNGSYLCSCLPGYTGTGKECIDMLMLTFLTNMLVALNPMTQM